MKKINNIIIFIAVMLFLTISCTKDFEEINTNPNEPTEVPTSYLLTNAQRTIFDDMWDEWWNGRFGLQYSQYWSQVVYTEESRYQPRVNITNTYWRLLYTDIMDLQEIIRLNTDAETSGIASASGSNNNQIAVARILKAFVFHMLTDTWGDIPYFEALQGASNSSPAYTPQEDIYADLLKELKEAQAQIELSGAGVVGDIIFDGDMEMWKKLANSLRMRIALRSSKVSANYIAEIQDAITDGPFTSSADDAFFTFDPAAPSYNPLYENFFIDNRHDFAVSAPMVDMLNGLSDPRLPIFADKPIDTTEYGASYTGMPYGMDNADATSYSGPSGYYVSLPAENTVLAADARAFLMTYAEVCFIKAEINGWDQIEYENGIEASMETWGVDAGVTATYIAGVPAASEENVMNQKWIANYMQGLQGWFEWRRTGYPTLSGPQGTVLGDCGNRIMPSRRPYPTDEQVLNEANYNAAVTSQGADNLSTRVWWDQ